MAMYKVWFDHHEGPYSTMIAADSQRDIEEEFADDPFFICAEPPDSDFEPAGRLSVQAMSAEAFGLDILNSELCPVCGHLAHDDAICEVVTGEDGDLCLCDLTADSVEEWWDHKARAVTSQEVQS